MLLLLYNIIALWLLHYSYEHEHIERLLDEGQFLEDRVELDAVEKVVLLVAVGGEDQVYDDADQDLKESISRLKINWEINVEFYVEFYIKKKELIIKNKDIS